jgi:hypothetical protein
MPYIRKVTDDPKLVIHSLRGTLKDKLRDAGVQKETNDFITGHGSPARDKRAERYADSESRLVGRSTFQAEKMLRNTRMPAIRMLRRGGGRLDQRQLHSH